MANVKKGGVTSSNRAAKSKTKILREVQSELEGEKPVAFISRTGADRAWLIPSQPIHGANGQYLGMDEGLHVDFGGVGITRGYYLSNPVDADQVDRIRAFIQTNHPLIHELGLEERTPEQPLPPLKKWDTLNLNAIKVALLADFGDDHEGNVAVLKQGVRYELQRPEHIGGPRKDLIAMLEALAATEEVETDAFAEDSEVELV